MGILNSSFLARMLTANKKRNIFDSSQDDEENQDSAYDVSPEDVNENDTNDLNAPTDNVDLAPEKPAPEKPGLFDQYKQLTNKPMPITDAYKNATLNPPNEDDYKPSKGRRLAAILGGMAAGYGDPEKSFAYAKNITEEPYREAGAQYKTKLANLKNLSEDEKDKLKIEMQGLNYSSLDQERTDRLAASKQAESDRTKDRETQRDLENQRIDVEKQRLKLELIRDAQAGAHYEKRTDGTVTKIMPDGTITNLGQIGLNEKELKQLEIDASEKRTQEIITGQNDRAANSLQARTTALDTRNKARMAEIDEKIKGNSKFMPQARQNWENFKVEAANHPEYWDYVQPNSKMPGATEVHMPWRGDDATYKKVQSILGAAAAVAPPSNTQPQTNTNSKELSKTQTNKVTGQKRVLYSYDNGATWTPTRKSQ